MQAAALGADFKFLFHFSYHYNTVANACCATSKGIGKAPPQEAAASMVTEVEDEKFIRAGQLWREHGMHDRISNDMACCLPLLVRHSLNDMHAGSSESAALTAYGSAKLMHPHSPVDRSCSQPFPLSAANAELGSSHTAFGGGIAPATPAFQAGRAPQTRRRYEVHSMTLWTSAR